MKLANNLYFYPEQGMLDSNTYVITGSPGIVVDPGNAEYLEGKLGGLRQDNINPKEIGIIINTHLHIDHCNANRQLSRSTRSRSSQTGSPNPNRSGAACSARLRNQSRCRL